MPSPKTVMLGLAAAMSLQGVNAYRCARVTTTITVTVTADSTGGITLPSVTSTAVAGDDDYDSDSGSSTAISSAAATTTSVAVQSSSSSPSSSSSSSSVAAATSAAATSAVVTSTAASSTFATSTIASSSSIASPAAATSSSAASSASSSASAAAAATTTGASLNKLKSSASGVNLLLNGDFDQASSSGAYDGSPAWSFRGKGKVTTDDSGTHVLYLPVPGYEDYSQATQTVTGIQDKHNYVLSYKRKVAASSTSYDDGHCFLIVSMGQSAVESYLLKKSNGWESHTSPAFTLRSTDKDLSFHVDCDGSSSGLDAYFDNISLVDQGAAASSS